MTLHVEGRYFPLTLLSSYVESAEVCYNINYSYKCGWICIVTFAMKGKENAKESGRIKIQIIWWLRLNLDN